MRGASGLLDEALGDELLRPSAGERAWGCLGWALGAAFVLGVLVGSLVVGRPV